MTRRNFLQNLAGAAVGIACGAAVIDAVKSDSASVRGTEEPIQALYASGCCSMTTVLPEVKWTHVNGVRLGPAPLDSHTLLMTDERRVHA